MSYKELEKDLESQPDNSAAIEGTAAKYRSVFGTSFGRDVLADLVHYAFEEIKTDDGVHWHNEAVAILTKMGIVKRGPEGITNAREIVDALVTLTGERRTNG